MPSGSPWSFIRRMSLWHPRRPEAEPRGAAMLSQDGRQVETMDVEAEVEISLNLTNFAQRILSEAETPLVDAKLVEIGPGSNLAHALHLSGKGVEITLADRFPTQWNEGFHRPVYEAFLKAIGEPSPLVELALAGEHHSRLRIVPEQAENLKSLRADTFDGCMSNAVLEHVFDFEATAEELYRITRPGGVHGHQIDFRDHRDFSRPLEFLTIADEQWEAEFAGLCYLHGNRVRPRDAEAAFKAAGFEITSTSFNSLADEAYLTDLVGRIPWNSRFNIWPRDDLAPGGALYFLRK